MIPKKSKSPVNQDRKIKVLRAFAFLIILSLLQIVNILWFRHQLMGFGLLEKQEGRYIPTQEAVSAYQYKVSIKREGVIVNEKPNRAGPRAKTGPKGIPNSQKRRVAFP